LQRKAPATFGFANVMRHRGMICVDLIDCYRKWRHRVRCNVWRSPVMAPPFGGRRPISAQSRRRLARRQPATPNLEEGPFGPGMVPEIHPRSRSRRISIRSIRSAAFPGRKCSDHAAWRRPFGGLAAGFGVGAMSPSSKEVALPPAQSRYGKR